MQLMNRLMLVINELITPLIGRTWKWYELFYHAIDSQKAGRSRKAWRSRQLAHAGRSRKGLAGSRWATRKGLAGKAESVFC